MKDNVITDPIPDPELIQEPMHPDALKTADADLLKYSPDQERDDHGRFGSGGGSSTASGGYKAGKDLIGSDLNNPILSTTPATFDLFSETPRNDKGLEDIAAKQGFDGPAQLVDQAQFDQMARESGYTRYRGVGSYTNAQGEVISGNAIVTDFATGQYYAGTGVSGNGIYFTSKPDTAQAYADKGDPPAAVISMTIVPGSKIADYDQVNLVLNEMRDPANPGGLDVGRVLAAKGFDGYVTVGNGVPATIMLNRTAMAVLKP